MTAATIFFVRHGQTYWNAEGRLQGQADTPLNDTGRQQATGNGEKLVGLIEDAAKIDFVASPLARTRETMERIRAAMGLEPTGYRTDPRLVELHFGDWQGHTFPELETVDPDCSSRRAEDKWGFLPPGEKAESYEMLSARIRPWLESVTRDTVCVTHGGVMRSVFRLTESLSPSECAALPIPQDKILRYAGGFLEWL
jgi:broad specificity phosphatase PhoE